MKLENCMMKKAAEKSKSGNYPARVVADGGGSGYRSSGLPWSQL